MVAGLPLRTLHRLQDHILRLVGNSVESRAGLVARMLHRDANEALSYWLQLVVSVGIATLGLVLGSAAVVIGAMLVAPLLGPIIGLAMGLATGSPFLVLRSAGRIGLSVVVAMVGAAAITWLLPFHELNAELSARATPTVLDLITAGFCALAGVYASLRSSSDTATTAAGTSIGISLVPPLCASGYGLGTLTWHMAGGAALLFLTNLVAIVVVGSVSFVAAGFNRVSVLELEKGELAEGRDAPIARILARRLAALFESKVGPALRFLMPFVLLALVYVPLRHALDEVAWEVRTRSAVRQALAAEPGHIVESKIQVARHVVEIVVVLLGTAQEAEAARHRLMKRLQRESGVVPSLEVIGVPDAGAFAGLQSTLLTPHPTHTEPPPLAPVDQLRLSADALRAELLRVWPAESSGSPFSVAYQLEDDGVVLRVAHLGPALTSATIEALERSLSRTLKSTARIRDEAMPAQPIERGKDDPEFLTNVALALGAARRWPQVVVCVTEPPDAPRKYSPAASRQLEQTFKQLTADIPPSARMPATNFSIRLQLEPCSRAPDR
ncbi:MAG TPA: DUF389 domain-containing protein [Polyangiaceae bacterium]|nr:DUF389 domain-containing protein [Polyangiaceae bacterium]